MKILYFVLTLLSQLNVTSSYALTYQEYKSELESHLKTLSRNVRFYHYAKIGFDRRLVMKDEVVPIKTESEYSAVPFRSSIYDLYFKKMTHRFEQGKGIEWSNGYGGLYAGIDPIQSQGYAHYPYVLLQLEVQPGTRYLVLNHKQTYINLGPIDKKRRKYFKRAVHELNVSFITYPWHYYSFNFCKNTVNSAGRNASSVSAVWFMNSQLTNPIDITGYSDGFTPNDPISEQYKRYAELANVYRFAHTSGINTEIFPTIIYSTFRDLPGFHWNSDLENETLIRNQTLGCHPDYVKEEL